MEITPNFVLQTGQYESIMYEKTRFVVIRGYEHFVIKNWSDCFDFPSHFVEYPNSILIGDWACRIPRMLLKPRFSASGLELYDEYNKGGTSIMIEV